LVEAMPPNALARLDADRRRCAAIAARAELAAQEALEQAAIEDGELQRVHELVTAHTASCQRLRPKLQHALCPLFECSSVTITRSRGYD